MNIAQLEIAGALASLNSSAQGLSASEAARRLREFGPNRIAELPRPPLAQRFAREFTHFFALILWVAAGLAFFAERREPGQGMATLGFAILGVIVINGVFSFWQEYRAERALDALRQLLPQQAKVLRAASVDSVAAEALVPGDVIVLEAGDYVPADCRLIEASAIRVNTATLTGESQPRPRHAAPVADATPLAARNLVLAGTSLIAGTGRALVYATGMHTEFGRIAHLTQAADAVASPLQREIARLSRLVALLAAALGGVFFLLGRAVGLPFWDDLMFAIGIIVANVPEGLLPTVTLSLAMATQRMAKRNALVRHLPAVETLGATTVICSDKTGTLTQNRMQVERLYVADALGMPREAPERAGLAGEHPLLAQALRYCNDLQPTQREQRWLGDPTEVALVEFVAPLRDIAPAQRIAEIPFDSDRRRMSVICESAGRRMLYCKGALESVFEATPALEAATRDEWLRAQDRMAEAGLRVLALAYRELNSAAAPAEEALSLLGLVGIEDPPRPEVPAAIQRCLDAGIKVVMVTGDHPHTAQAIAREIGLVRSAAPTVISGEQLAHLSAIQLQLALDAREVLFARVSAEQKMRIVQALQAKGHIVAVTGDGVNDAPALKAADIGIAMGLAGTDVAKEAADMVLLDDNFASIVNAIEEGRAVFDNIRKFLTYILTSNIPELVPYLAFVLFKIPLPLTVIQILAVDLGTDMLPALALGAEAPHRGLMKRPPRPRGERLLHWPLILRAYLFLGVMEAAIALAAFFLVLHAGGWHYGDFLSRSDPLYLEATTACLAAIVVAQVANVFLCRDQRESALRFGLSGNPLLVWAIGAELLLIAVIVYTPWGQKLFGTAALTPAVWVFAVALALVMFALEEARKRLVRGYEDRRLG